VLRLLTLALVVAFPLTPARISAQAIPDRPEGLRFAPSRFDPPPVAGLRFELRNGLPVYVVPDRTLPLVDVVLALPVGDRNEGPGEDGLASMTAAMARRGGAGELGPEELDDEIDALGARLQESSSWARTVLALDTGSEALDRGLELLASILFEPRFDEQRLAQAKDSLRVSLLAEGDDPRTVLDREWSRLVHGPVSPRSRRLTEASLAAFQREALIRFHRRHWRPEGAVIAVSGDVDGEALVARLDELFGGWEASDRTASETMEASAEPASPGAAKRRTRPEIAAASPGWWLVDRQGTQAALALGHRGAVFNSWDNRDRWALMLLVEILDGPGAVSRLRSRLQLEEGLTYRVLTWFDLDVVPAGRVRGQPPVPSAGEFRIFLETAPESVAVAAAAVLEELGRLRRGDVADAEIATARRSLAARLPLLFDRAEVIAGRYAEDELLGRPHEHWSLYRQRLGTVTVTDLRRVAQRYIDMDGIALLVVGDSAAVQAGRGADELRRLLGPPAGVPD